MIAVIDYDIGNLHSVGKALERVGGDVRVTRDVSLIRDASHVVLPGVGAFAGCMEKLASYGLVDAVKEAALSGKPFLGICVGLQLLFDESEEFGTQKGLAVLGGKVVRFPTPLTSPGASGDASNDTELKVPHMGWNAVKKSKESPLLEGIDDGEYFYFVHSYYAVPTDDTVTLTTTAYGADFTSAVEKDNLFATQFHPEKSQGAGLKLLKNFTRLR